MQCKKCGAELIEGDLFCGECGTKVEEEAATSKQDKVVNEKTTHEDPEETKKQLKKRFQLA